MRKIRSRNSSSARHKVQERASREINERMGGTNEWIKRNEGTLRATNARGEPVGNGTISSDLGEKVDTRLRKKKGKA